MKTLKTIGKYVGIGLLFVLGTAIFAGVAFLSSLFQAADSLYHKEQGHVPSAGVQD